MPIYGYRCQDCGHELDALQKMSDDPLTDCPACGQASLKRQLSAPRFRLKGGGWYETDFKTDNKRNLADGKSESADKSAGKTDTGGDSKKSGDSSAKKASA
ncbi:MAG: zinc ribbon domain-containing protein [Pseudomonadota bacterium]